MATAARHEAAGGFEVCGRLVGAPSSFCLIAGPCTVESREQTLTVARAVQEAGASMLRGGAFKPRTSPYSFQGLGLEGLEILAEARAATGLPAVTELLDPRHAEALAEHADVIQIGARNMANVELLRLAAEIGKPVVLKRGLDAKLEELLGSAEVLLDGGLEQVLLCERGIRTFETATRFTLDLAAVPWLKLRTHLPVIVDPSHASGDSRLVEPMACAAVAAGADGLLIEVHHQPEEALCDGAQAVTASDFDALTGSIRLLAAAMGKKIA